MTLNTTTRPYEVQAGSPLVLDADAVRSLLPKLNVRQLLEDMFRSRAEGRAVQPPQTLTLFPEGAGDFISYLGVLGNAGVFGVKMSPYIKTDGRPIISAWTSLMSMHTGQPLLWCDSALLTVERTAGATALAIDYLAPVHSKRLALIGCGAVGQAHLKHVAKLRVWSEIRVYAADMNDAIRAAMTQIDTRVTVSDDTMHCIADADVVMLCTSSATPVISIDDLNRPALITSISTNAVNAHEIPPAALHQMDVFCDDKQTTPASAGEMVLATQLHNWDPIAVHGDLADLASGKVSRPTYDKPVFFRSIGLGLEDVAIAHALLELAQQSSPNQ